MLLSWKVNEVNVAISGWRRRLCGFLTMTIHGLYVVVLCGCGIFFMTNLTFEEEIAAELARITHGGVQFSYSVLVRDIVLMSRKV